MRLTGIVRGVNGWFARVVYQRDEWDEKLERWSKEWSWQFQLVLYVARAGVWISRLILKGLMHGGHAISCFMMRQMEYDADSYEAKLAGTDAFVTTAGRLRELNAATQFAYRDLGDGYQRGALPQDFAGFIAERCRHLPDDLLAKVREHANDTTGTFDTHPCDSDRITAVRAIAAPGVIVGAETPAMELFHDFHALSVAASRHHFEHDLGIDTGALTFVDTDAAIRESRSREEESAAIGRFFDECFSVWRPLHLPMNELQSLDEAALRAELAAARQTMTSGVDEVKTKFAAFNAFEGRRGDAYAAQELFVAGFSTVNHQDFGLSAPTIAAATAAEEDAAQEQRELGTSLEQFETAAGRRLACGVLLSRDGEGAEDGATLANAFSTLTGTLPELREMQRVGYAAETLGYNVAGGEATEQVIARYSFLQQAMASRSRRVREILGDAPCPSSLTMTPMTLAERCGLGEQALEPSEARARTLKLYLDLLGRLCALTMRVEQRM